MATSYLKGSVRVLRIGTTVPMELGYITLLVQGCVHQCRSSQTPVLLGFYGGFLR